MNLKQISHKNYVIFGEPIYSKYATYLDYGKNKVGFAIKREHFQKQYINVVTLIRFLMFIFTFGKFALLFRSLLYLLCSSL